MEEIRRKSKAANDRVCNGLVASIWRGVDDKSDLFVSGALNLFGEAHEKNLRARGSPVVLKVHFGSRSDGVVGGLKALEQLRQLSVNVGGQD